MINKLKRISKSKYFPFVILFFVVLILHIFMKPDIVDDYKFKLALDNQTLIEWLNNRYMTWSSRLIIEGLLAWFLSTSFFLWKIIDSLIVVLLAYSMSKLFVKDHFIKKNWLIVMWLMIIPIEILASAGWITSSLNYLWPLSLGMYGLIGIKKELSNEKISIINYILYIGATLFAVNHEQMVFVILIIYLIYIIYNMIKKKISLFAIIIFIISIASIIFIMTCPGNYIRFEADATITGYVDYNVLSFIDKIVLGITSMMAHFILRHGLLFLLFTGLIFFIVFKNYKNKLYRMIAFIPFSLSIIFSIISNLIFVINLSHGDFIDNYTKAFLINADNFYSPLAYVPLMIYLLIIGTIIISLYLVFKHTYKSIIAISIFLIGLGTRIIMGFSPTVFSSLYRPDFFMAISLLICGYLMYDEVKGKDKDIYNKAVGIISFISLVLNFIFVFTYE